MVDATTSPTVEKLLGFKVPSAEEIYDVIMGGIEKDLITENIPKLPEKYAGETEEEKKERYARYDRAFEEYERRFNQWLENIKAKYEQARQRLRKLAERKTHEQERQALEDIESTLASM